MNIRESFSTWLTDLLCISQYDRKVERKFWKMHRLQEKGGFINRKRALRLENKLQEKYQLKISRYAKIGKNFQIRHPMGIRIGKTAEIGDNCKVYPFFVAMAAVKDDRELIINHIRRHPKIGNDCMLCSKATVIGPVTIGDDVIIGACAVVTKDVPSHSVVKGVNQIRPKRPDEIPDKYKGDNI
jgi:serine O-acetyltransferase